MNGNRMRNQAAVVPARSRGVFRYDGFELDPSGRTLTGRYSLDGRSFTEWFELVLPGSPGSALSHSVSQLSEPPNMRGVRAAARLVYLLAGISYYKTGAPAKVEVDAASEAECRFLRHFYLEGLGEFAYRNSLDLSDLTIESRGGPPGPDSRAARRQRPPTLLPLIPFGGGIDSIVTVEEVRRRAPASALFVVAPGGRRFAAIEGPADKTGLPIIHLERHLDPVVLRPDELGYLKGHVPVTGIYSAAAVWAAARCGQNAVVMSNEWSSSLGNVIADGRSINHQYSKSLDFENGFRDLLAAIPDLQVDYFSYLRARSELWVAQRFAQLPGYHRMFRSCNRAFHIDPHARLEQWCGECDKCCFIDLVLAPFLDARQLAGIFDGKEPLQNAELLPRFRTLIGTAGSPKPWECVGEPGECAAAVALAAARPDRAGSPVLRHLADEAKHLLTAPPETYLKPMGPDHVPHDLQAQDLLV